MCWDFTKKSTTLRCTAKHPMLHNHHCNSKHAWDTSHQILYWLTVCKRWLASVSPAGMEMFASLQDGIPPGTTCLPYLCVALELFPDILMKLLFFSVGIAWERSLLSLPLSHVAQPERLAYGNGFSFSTLHSPKWITKPNTQRAS